jgi:hypothetical protein
LQAEEEKDKVSKKLNTHKKGKYINVIKTNTKDNKSKL